MRFLQQTNYNIILIIQYLCSAWFLDGRTSILVLNPTFHLTMNTVIVKKFTYQNFQFKIIQPKKFSSLKVISKNFYG